MIGGNAHCACMRSHRTVGATMGATARSFPSASASAHSARLLSSLATTNGQLLRSHPRDFPLHARNGRERDTFLHGFYMVSTRFLHGFPCPHPLNCRPVPHLPIREKLVFANTPDEPTPVPACLCGRHSPATLPNQPNSQFEIRNPQSLERTHRPRPSAVPIITSPDTTPAAQ